MISIFLERQQAIIKIDLEDLPIFSAYRWQIRKAGNSRYVYRNSVNKGIYLHREIMRPDDGLDIDHIDGNGLNNCRSNLRAITHQKNAWNRQNSDQNGVTFHKRRSLWRATIMHNQKKIELGYFDKKEDAEKARDLVAIKLRGEYCVIQAPDSIGLIDHLSLSPSARHILSDQFRPLHL